jgi:hypothetical protein
VAAEQDKRDLRPPADELVKLVQKAEDGDQKALARVREIFNAVPAVWEGYGNVATTAERVMVNLIANGNPLVREGTEWKIAQLKQELAGGTATPLEQLLIQRVVLCWLHSNHADTYFAASMKASLPLSAVDFVHRCQDRAHKRFLSAVKSLALVQKLAVPERVAPVVKEGARRGEFLELEETQAARVSAG